MATRTYEGYKLEIIDVSTAGSNTITGANAVDAPDIASFANVGGTTGIKAYLDPAHVDDQTGAALGIHYNGIEGLEGTTFGDELYGDANNNFLFGLAGNDTLDGAGGTNVISGGEGNDLIIASAGMNEIRGDAGDGDTVSYANAASGIVLSMSRAVDNAGAAAGDLVYTVENVIGTNFNDYIIGSSVANSLEGGKGDDKFDGYSGADTFNGGEGSDWVYYDYSNSGVTVSLKDNTTDAAANGATGGDAEGDRFVSIENIFGSSRADNLTGNNAANILNGYYGADTMRGEGGNDIYYVDADNSGIVDTVVESDASAAGGIDLVMTAVSYALGANVENLTAIKGENATTLTGNTLNNVITGNEKNNVINGGTGADTMIGGAGNDTYYIDNVGDEIIDTAGANVVYTSVTYTGLKFAGKVIATGTNAIELKGDAQNNVLTGNAGANKINGGLGNDVLTGGAGKDTFVFDTPLKKANVDKIVDFSVKDDTVYLDNKYMAKLGKGTEAKPGKLNKKFFAFDKAKDGNDHLVYNKKTGVLSYDKDGSGEGKAVEILKLSKNLKLTSNDFMIV